MKEKNKDKKFNEYFAEDISAANNVNRKFIGAVDVVASVELFEEYVYAKRNLRVLENVRMEDELTDRFLYIDDIVMNFKHILNMEGALKSKKIYELYQIKRTLLNYYEEYRFLSAYSNHIFRLYSYWCNKNDRYRHKYDLKMFYSGLYNSLRNREGKTIKSMQREILSVIPTRVTKDFFLSYIQDSLSGRIEEDPDGVLEEISDIYGIVNEDYYEGESLSGNPNFERLKAYAGNDYRRMTGRKLRRYCKELNHFTLILNTVCEVIWPYIMALNRIMIILLDFDMDYAALIELEPLVYTSHRYVVDLDDKQQDTEGKAILHEIRPAARKWYDILKRYSLKIENMSNSELEEGDFFTDELVDFINYFYYLNIVALENEDLNAGDYYDVTSDDLYDVLDSIIRDVDVKLDILKPDEKKIMISDVMSSVAPDFSSLSDFVSFVKKSIEFDTNDAEKAVAIKGINSILDHYRYLD